MFITVELETLSKTKKRKKYPMNFSVYVRSGDSVPLAIARHFSHFHERFCGINLRVMEYVDLSICGEDFIVNSPMDENGREAIELAGLHAATIADAHFFTFLLMKSLEKHNCKKIVEYQNQEKRIRTVIYAGTE